MWVVERVAMNQAVPLSSTQGEEEKEEVEKLCECRRPTMVVGTKKKKKKKKAENICIRGEERKSGRKNKKVKLRQIVKNAIWTKDQKMQFEAKGNK